MPKKKNDPHPDDFMTVTLSLEFRAKPNPQSSDPPPLDTTLIDFVLAASDAVDCLEKVVAAIRERRLYGLMIQEAAESHVGAGEWIEETMEDLISKAKAQQESKNKEQE